MCVFPLLCLPIEGVPFMERGGVCPICGSHLEYVENVEEINKLTKVFEKLDKI